VAVVNASVSARPRPPATPQAHADLSIHRVGPEIHIAWRRVKCKRGSKRCESQSQPTVGVAHEASRDLDPKESVPIISHGQFEQSDYDHSRMRASVRISNAFETAAVVEMTSWRLKKEKKEKTQP
jgi:hypothetical protein